MKTLEGKTRVAFLLFFISHIPATLLIDLQAIFPHLYPEILRDILKWYTDIFNDDLMRGPHDTWFKAIVGGELLMQLPFFFVAVYALMNSHKVDGKGWFRSACMIYGSHTATTLIPILACHIANPDASSLEKILVVSIYLPYLLFPLWLVFISVVSENVFGKSKSNKSNID